MKQRYEREIEEILGETAGPPPSGESSKKVQSSGGVMRVTSEARRPTRGFPWSFRLRLSSRHLGLIGAVLLLAAMILSYTSVPLAVGVTAALGVGFLVLAWILIFLQTEPEVEKRWRGRVIEDGTSSASWANRLRRWLGSSK
jgi:hypothetical protein